MANAGDAVRRAAQAVTLSNDEDGMAAAIERYVLDG
jgi:hydroxymethylpyrimidine pyrophosphatase-like HAD family hydrolase